MTEKPKCTDERHQYAETAICTCCCIYLISYVVLKVASDADSCFVANEISGVVKLVSEDPFEGKDLLVTRIVYKFERRFLLEC